MAVKRPVDPNDPNADPNEDGGPQTVDSAPLPPLDPAPTPAPTTPILPPVLNGLGSELAPPTDPNAGFAPTPTHIDPVRDAVVNQLGALPPPTQPIDPNHGPELAPPVDPNQTPPVLMAKPYDPNDPASQAAASFNAVDPNAPRTQPQTGALLNSIDQPGMAGANNPLDNPSFTPAPAPTADPNPPVGGVPATPGTPVTGGRIWGDGQGPIAGLPGGWTGQEPTLAGGPGSVLPPALSGGNGPEGPPMVDDGTGVGGNGVVNASDPNSATAMDTATRSALMNLLSQSQQPINAETINESPEAQAFRLQSQRGEEQQRANMAETAAQNGTEGGMEGANRGLDFATAEGNTKYVGDLAQQKQAQQDADLKFAIQSGLQSGQAGQQLGFNYSQLGVNANQQALLAELQALINSGGA